MMQMKRCMTLDINIWLMTGEGLTSVHLYHYPLADGVQTTHFIMNLGH